MPGLRTFFDPANRTWIAAGLVVSAFAVRFAAAAVLGLAKEPEDGSDSQEYDTYAWNLVEGRGYRGMSPDVSDRDHLTAYRPPGTSVIWAGLYALFGHRYDVVRVFNCLTGAASVALVYAIGLRCFGAAAALLAAALYAVWPIAVFFSASLLSEVPGTLLFLGYIFTCLTFADRPTWRSALLAGVLLGVAVLTRPNPVFMIPFTGVWALWQFRGDRAALWKGLAILLFAMAAMSPWWVRNALVFGRFIPISTMGGSVLLQGNNRIVLTDPDLYGSSIWDTRIPEYRKALEAPNDEVERDRVAGRLGIEWLKAHVSDWPRLAGNKVVRGWTPVLRPHTPAMFRYGTLVSWGPVFVLFLIGFVPTLASLLRKGRPGWLLHLAILGSLPMTMIFFGELRYRYTVEPLCIIIAAATAVDGWGRIHSKRLTRNVA